MSEPMSPEEVNQFIAAIGLIGRGDDNDYNDYESGVWPEPPGPPLPVLPPGAIPIPWPQPFNQTEPAAPVRTATMAERLLRRAEELRAAEAARLERIHRGRLRKVTEIDERHEELLSAMSSMSGLYLSGVRPDSGGKTSGTIDIQDETRSTPIVADDHYYSRNVKIRLREECDGQEGRTMDLIHWRTGDVQINNEGRYEGRCEILGWRVDFINPYLRTDFRNRCSDDLNKSHSLNQVLDATVEMLSPFVSDQPTPDPVGESPTPDRKGLDL